MERGRIQNRERSLQVKDYSGLRYQNITPSDVDGMIEFRGRLYVLLEYKASGYSPIPRGQRYALASFTDALAHKPGAKAIAIIAQHDTPPGREIDCASAEVLEIRYQGKWHFPEETLSVRELINRMLEEVGLLEHYKE